MKRLTFIFFLLFLCSIDIIPREQDHYSVHSDSLITAIISNINSDSIKFNIQSLQDFQTRFMFAQNRFEVADWIENRFHQIGILDVERDTFMCQSFYGDTTTMQINVIGTITGTNRPQEVYIIGGHYDCYAGSNSLNFAPGADDNASGTSAALEFARALIESGYQPEVTIKFIAFAAEELMLYGDAGCEHYAQKAKNENMNIKLMINCDMISNTESTLEQSNVRINYYSGFQGVRNIAIDATQQFSLINPVIGSLNQYSDSYPFYEEGYAAVYFEEYDFSPYYHTPEDIIDNYNMDYCREVCKSASATLLKYIFLNPPDDIEDENTLPNNFTLYQNYPNPFNPVTIIKYSIAKTGLVDLRVYDNLGREVKTLVNQELTAGNYEVEFSADKLASGIYYYRLISGSLSESRKMILLH